MMKLFLSVLTLILLAGGLLGFNPGGRRYHLMSPISRPEQVLLSRITELTELVTLRVPVSTVITSEIAGYTGSVSCVVVVHGDVELGVDLEQSRFENVDPGARTATLVLPEPKVRRASLDHERTGVYSIDREGLWCLSLSDEAARHLVNVAMQEAQTTVESAARDRELADQARRRTERILKVAMEPVDWNARVVWSDGQSAPDPS